MLEILTTLLSILAVMSLVVVSMLIIVLITAVFTVGAITGIHIMIHATVWWHVLLGLILTVACTIAAVSVLFYQL